MDLVKFIIKIKIYFFKETLKKEKFLEKVLNFIKMEQKKLKEYLKI